MYDLLICDFFKRLCIRRDDIFLERRLNFAGRLSGTRANDGRNFVGENTNKGVSPMFLWHA